jgi:NitT/TauT family transport system substrate-binding protein
MYIPAEKGYFEEEGVNAEIVLINDDSQLVSALASNKVQMLISAADFTTILADAGIDAPQIFSTDTGYGSDGLVVKNDINSISDLKGKKVHLALGFPSHFFFRFMAEKTGLQADDVEFVNITADQVGAGFVAGQIDYGMTWEPWLSKASERTDGKVLFTSREEDGIITDTIVARRDLIENRREDVKRIMRAFFKGVEFWKENPEEANAIMAKNFNIPVDEYSAMMDTIKPLDYDANLKKFNPSSERSLFELASKAADYYFEDGIIQSKPDVSKLIDASLLKELY